MSPKSIDVLTNEISHVKASLDEFKEDTAARFDKFERLLSSHMEREEAQSKEDANDMKNLIAGLEGKYAAKWAEKIIVGGVVMILVSFWTLVGLAVVNTVKQDSETHVTK